MKTLATLLLLSTGLLAGSAAAQTTYTWAGGTGLWTEAARWTPAGVPAAADTAVIATGTVTLTENTTVAGFELSGSGILNGNADFTVTSAMTWISQFPVTGIQGEGSVTVAPSAMLQMTGDAPNGRYNMSGGRTLVSQGQAVWETAAGWEGAGRFVNEGELILPFDAPTPQRLCFSSTVDAITNGPTGLIRRTGTGEATIYCGFSNAGTVRVEDGVVNLRGFGGAGGTDTGNYEVEAAGTLVFGGGVRTVTETASVSGDGEGLVTGGRTTVAGSFTPASLTLDGITGGSTATILTLNGDAAVDTLTMIGGRIEGTGTLTVADALDWTGGRMEQLGTTIVASTATLSVSGDGQKGVSYGRTFRHEGTGTWSGTGRFSNGADALFLNAGVLEVSAGTTDPFGSFFGDTFTNTGTFTLTSGTVTRFSSFFHNEGTVEIVSGTLVLSGFNADGGTDIGRYVVAEGARLEFTGGVRTLTATAEIAGTGTVVAAGLLTNAATWQPGASPGVLTVDSNYPAGAGTLEMELGGLAPGTEYDRLAVTGTATLGGTLRLTLADGFVPAVGDAFAVVTASPVAGTFAAVEPPDGVTVDVAYTDSTATVMVTGVTVANEPEAALPTEPALRAPYPNPVAEQAAIPFDLPEPGRVRLAVYDVLGREVAVLVDAERTAGRYEAALDVGGLAAGLYLVRMTAGAFVQTQRVTLLR